METTLCCEESGAAKKSPFLRIQAQAEQQTSKFPIITMNSAFSRNKAAQEAVLILRYFANQYAKKCSEPSSVNDFLDNINREIALKSGDFKPELIAVDALMNRFLKR
jgi:hypothetical protein